jgi:hypothetical protein
MERENPKLTEQRAAAPPSSGLPQVAAAGSVERALWSLSIVGSSLFLGLWLTGLAPAYGARYEELRVLLPMICLVPFVLLSGGLVTVGVLTAISAVLARALVRSELASGARGFLGALILSAICGSALASWMLLELPLHRATAAMELEAPSSGPAAGKDQGR